MNNKEIYVVLKIDRNDKDNIEIFFINYFLEKKYAIQKAKDLKLQEQSQYIEYLLATWKK